MILTKEDIIKLNYLSHSEGAEAVEHLGKILWDYYAKQTVMNPENKELNSGMAQLADWLKKLPKGLQDAKSAGQ